MYTTPTTTTPGLYPSFPEPSAPNPSAPPAPCVLYSTVSCGRTYIARDKANVGDFKSYFVGDVNSYNNFFTRFFARLFEVSIQVNFDGKWRDVNKKSYVKLLHKLGITDARVSNLAQYTRFKPYTDGIDLTGKTMREALPYSKQERLLLGLGRAILQNNTEKALRKIGKGALVDQAYYDRGVFGPSLYSEGEGLSSERRYQFSVFLGAPIMQAARKGLTDVARRLHQVDARIDCVGQSYTFLREITGIDRWVTQRRVDVIVHGRKKDHVVSQTIPEEHTVVRTADAAGPVQQYRLDPTSYTLVQTC